MCSPQRFQYVFKTFSFLLFVSLASSASQDFKKACTKGFWNSDLEVTKSSGSKVKVSFLDSNKIKMNWFQAASCCKYWDQSLISIGSAKDLEEYYKVIGNRTKQFNGWTDVTGFGKDWRNSKGKYIEKDSGMFSEKPPKEAVKGSCRQIATQSSDPDVYFLGNEDCTATATEFIYCEKPDPLEPDYNFDCQSKHPHKPSQWHDQSYWENLLAFNPDCDGFKELCMKGVWTTDYVTKSTGSTVKITGTETKMTMNWFEAASCCQSRDQTLISIGNSKDLAGYQDTLKSKTEPFKGWTDVNGFGKDWRNFKGKYIEKNSGVFTEEPPQPITRGFCKTIDTKADQADKYYLKSLECNTKVTEFLYCEQDDVLEPSFNYNCSLDPPDKTIKWPEQSYWEDILSYNTQCDVTVNKSSSPKAEGKSLKIAESTLAVDSVEDDVLGKRSSKSKSSALDRSKAANDYKATCMTGSWKVVFVTKSTGSVVKVANTQGRVKMNWYQAASCCKWWGSQLVSISNEKDLKGYYDVNKLNPYPFGGWTDVTGFGKDWRNMKGKYLEKDSKVFEEDPPSPAKWGLCKKMTNQTTGKYVLTSADCNIQIKEYVFCEQSDPLEPFFIYTNPCEIKLASKANKWQDQTYWENILSENVTCPDITTTPRPTLPPSVQVENTTGKNSKFVEYQRTCMKSQWTVNYVNKSTGSTVKIAGTRKAVKMNWFQAASCCRWWEQNLVSISNAKDLEEYRNIFGATSPVKFRSWTDVTGFGDGWRNSKGKYIEKDSGIFTEDPPLPVAKGSCKQIGVREDDPDKYYLSNVDCDTVANEILYCELDDPLEPDYNFSSCGSKPSKLKKTNWPDQNYWETWLTDKPICEDIENNTKTNRKIHHIPLKSDCSVPSEGAKVDGNTKYVFIDQKLRWERSRDYCKKNGMVLATIRNYKEQEILEKYIDSYVEKEKDIIKDATFWFGGTDYKSEGNFHWTTGERIEFQKFWNHNPNNDRKYTRGMYGEHCVDLKYSPDSKESWWNDQYCHKTKQFFCEFPQSQSHCYTIPSHDEILSPPELKEVEGTGYYNSGTLQLNWTKANDFCKEKELSLASVSDMDTMKTIANVLKSDTKPFTHYWTSGVFKPADLNASQYDSLTWSGRENEPVSGNDIKYLKWFKNEPSDQGGIREENCVDILNLGNGQIEFSAVHCSLPLQFICTKK